MVFIERSTPRGQCKYRKSVPNAKRVRSSECGLLNGARKTPSLCCSNALFHACLYGIKLGDIRQMAFTYSIYKQTKPCIMQVVYYHLECLLRIVIIVTRQRKGGVGATLFFYCLCFQYLPDLPGNTGHIEWFLNKPVASFVHDPLCLIV
jgi:hypothetical protein